MGDRRGLGDLGAAWSAKKLRARISGSRGPTHSGMSPDLPVQTGPETGSRHITSPASGPLQRAPLGSLAPPGVPPPAGEGSAQPGPAHLIDSPQPHPFLFLPQFQARSRKNCWGPEGFLFLHSFLQMPESWPMEHHRTWGFGLVLGRGLTGFDPE